MFSHKTSIPCAICSETATLRCMECNNVYCREHRFPYDHNCRNAKQTLRGSQTLQPRHTPTKSIVIGNDNIDPIRRVDFFVEVEPKEQFASCYFEKSYKLGRILDQLNRDLNLRIKNNRSNERRRLALFLRENDTETELPLNRTIEQLQIDKKTLILRII
ncbi:hypothetical protein PCE1_002658 [Barthelona sp. PCE]